MCPEAATAGGGTGAAVLAAGAGFGGTPAGLEAGCVCNAGGNSEGPLEAVVGDLGLVTA